MSVKRILLTVFLFAMLLLTGCKASKDSSFVSLNTYTIWENPDAASHTEAVTLLQTLTEQKFDFSIKTGNGSEDSRIIFVTDAVIADEYNYSLDGLYENGFRIFHDEGVLFIFSPSQKGLNRAVYYLTHRLTNEQGGLLLAAGESYTDNGYAVKNQILVGSTPLSEYTIICSEESLLSARDALAFYIQQTCGEAPKAGSVSANEVSDSSYIRLLLTEETSDTSAPHISIADGNITIAGATPKMVQEGIILFADTYLGWIKAGTAEEHISNTASSLSLPINTVFENPWIDQREAIITLWNINYARGTFLNSNTSLKCDVMSFSEDQLYEYVKMLKFCGFTGIQVTDMCSAWAGAGGYEYVHERIRILADAAHSLDMNFTLWVWGSEFTGYGWVDNSVTYEILEGTSFVYENPDAVACFEKYYSIYAELADCCDRLIIHYYDPGNLTHAEDIAYFAGMLRDKFFAVNPQIDFGISCWVDIFDKNAFVAALGNDITLYESGHHTDLTQYNAFRSFTLNTGCRLGTWAWNTCEMEIDQLAQLNFNLEHIRNVYQDARNYDSIMKPSYWSEMDSYHVLNAFSLYCAGQLLINPDRDSDELVSEVAMYAVGEEYADAFAQILLLIQDARTGTVWDTYWWSTEDFILRSDDYPAEDILNRCNTYIPILEEMIARNLDTNTMPFPISLTDVLKLMLPHLQQIRDFAEFRIAFDALKADYAAGVSTDILQNTLNEIATPINEYNCIIGLWGQIEARAQQELISLFCQESGLTQPLFAYYDAERIHRIYSQLVVYQKGKNEPVITYYPYFQYGIAYRYGETDRLIRKMIEDGLLVETANGGVYLADWDNYIYQFN